MRTILLTVALLTLFYSCILAYQISLDSPSFSSNLDSIQDSHREKRQLENFDDEYPTASQREEEEPGFWDRIVKVALKLFSRFVEWLNSS
ncbi:hypothetical protein PYW08_014850 [Mythimna loreyi]|uniref:Uncharacterized protein n=1 Tax=Mythimna loreyi TaxID=667449 RepID=A0ACC2R5Q4_9NEOP|nr:hypothetical protein PYW08_014850 [Mythimna loreyi]